MKSQRLRFESEDWSSGYYAERRVRYMQMQRLMRHIGYSCDYFDMDGADGLGAMEFGNDFPH